MISICMASCGGQSDRAIEKAVRAQMEEYPRSTLFDIYKNFFQDRFGPGHIIADTSSASAYLMDELASADHFNGPLYEPTGAEGNFYRVNLSVIKDGLIDYRTYFDTFIESVQAIVPPSGEEWVQEWERINGIIARMPARPAGYEKDSAVLDSLLAGGHYVMHHSEAYTAAYDPHYRIIGKAEFEKRILPRLSSH